MVENYHCVKTRQVNICLIYTITQLSSSHSLIRSQLLSTTKCVASVQFIESQPQVVSGFSATEQGFQLRLLSKTKFHGKILFNNSERVIVLMTVQIQSNPAIVSKLVYLLVLVLRLKAKFVLRRNGTENFEVFLYFVCESFY